MYSKQIIVDFLKEKQKCIVNEEEIKYSTILKTILVTITKRYNKYNIISSEFIKEDELNDFILQRRKEKINKILNKC